MNLDIRFDFDRRKRLGLVEAIWGEDKNIDQLIRLSKEVLSKKEVVLITRINKKKANPLLDIFKEANFYQDAKCLIIGDSSNKLITNKRVAIVAGGSSDLHEGCRRHGHGPSFPPFHAIVGCERMCSSVRPMRWRPALW